mmetsp:Transcript_55855/g.146922  ORF Transcript_55855/g.146922 Transcript_55855/m.146922 type:complete len:350 (-) Transcript_55855:587-1636(-)
MDLSNSHALAFLLTLISFSDMRGATKTPIGSFGSPSTTVQTAGRGGPCPVISSRLSTPIEMTLTIVTSTTSRGVGMGSRPSASRRRCLRGSGSRASARPGTVATALSTCRYTQTWSVGTTRSQTKRPFASLTNCVPRSKLSRDVKAQTAVASPVYSSSMGCQLSQIQHDVRASRASRSRLSSISRVFCLSRASRSVSMTFSMSCENSLTSSSPLPSASTLATSRAQSSMVLSRPMAFIAWCSSPAATAPEPSASTCVKAARMAVRSASVRRTFRFLLASASSPSGRPQLCPLLGESSCALGSLRFAAPATTKPLASTAASLPTRCRPRSVWFWRRPFPRMSQASAWMPL